MSSRGDGAAAPLLGIGVMLALAWMSSALLGDRGVDVPRWLFPGLAVAWLGSALLVVAWSARADLSAPGAPYRPPSPAHVRAAVATIERLTGRATWTSPYTLHQRFRRGARDGEAYLWIGAPPAGEEPALRVALQAPGGGARQGPRIVRIGRGDAALVVAPALREAVRRLLDRCDEVVIAGGRVEARVRSPGDAVALLLDPARLDALLGLVEAAVEAAPTVAVRAAAAAEQTCPYCRDPVDEADPTCEVCATPHHAECLAEHGRCTVLGCKGGGRGRVRGKG